MRNFSPLLIVAACRSRLSGMVITCRFAWLQLHRQCFDDALALVRSGIRKYATHHGVSHIFHETITTAWVKLLATHHEDSFAEFIRINETRLNRELLYRFWTPSALDSECARSGWLPPDREPLPELKYH
jgi:hypothetical protein